MSKHAHIILDPENGVMSEFDAIETEYEAIPLDEVNELFGFDHGIDLDE